MSASIEQLDADGLAEYLAQEFKLEPQGAPVLAGDAAIRERETARQHWQRCAGCISCWPESFERESDI